MSAAVVRRGCLRKEGSSLEGFRLGMASGPLFVFFFSRVSSCFGCCLGGVVASGKSRQRGQTGKVDD